MEKPNKQMMDVFEEYGAFWHEKEKSLEIYPDGFQQEIFLTSQEEVNIWYKKIKEKLKKKKIVKNIKKKSVKDDYLCFVIDDDGHWYKIPLSLKKQFEDWSENYRIYENQLNVDDLEDVPDFNDYRCMHPVNYMFKSINVLKEN